mgnify:FL=1
MNDNYHLPCKNFYCFVLRINKNKNRHEEIEHKYQA